MAELKSVAIFGATGSIGASTLDLIASHPERYRVSVLTCHKNVEALAKMAIKFNPEHVVVADESQYESLKKLLQGKAIEIHAGAEALADAARLKADLVVLAITGIAGLMPTMAAVEAGQVIATANKESLVTAGALIMAKAEENGATILPIDSEHNAVFQILAGQDSKAIKSITLTASGGPFWGWSHDDMAKITPPQAVKHPRWSMGKKVSVDSATMMNKGLEVIEAAVLFDLPEDRVHVLVHPSSVVHGMVQYCDGSLLAQMGVADMRVAISYALAWPERLDWGAEMLNLEAMQALEFYSPDDGRFPCLNLAREASRRGGLMPTVLNGANEVGVDFFLSGRLGFLDIARLNRHILEEMAAMGDNPVSLDDVLEADKETRRRAAAWLNKV